MLRVLGFVVISILCTSVPLFSQSPDSVVFGAGGAGEGAEVPVELQIIRDYRSGNSLESKRTAIQFAENYIKSGNKDKELCDELTILALEGTRNRLISNGRLANNFPQIRSSAVRLLAEIGTEDARLDIIAVMRADTEPDVIYEAMLGLAKIGGENLQNSAQEAAQVFNRHDAKAIPDSRVAKAFLTLCQDYLRAGIDSKDKTTMLVIQRIADNEGNRYTYNIRNLAIKMLKDYMASLVPPARASR